MSNDKEARFVDESLKKCLEPSNSVKINVDFLGSGDLASKHKGAGEKYGNYRDVYYKFYISGDVCTIELTFSGPTPLDIKKPTIKSLTKDAIVILDDLIANIDLLKKNNNERNAEKRIITINIKGHSRGGVIATEVRRWLINMKRNATKEHLIIGSIATADPYSGPINRLFSMVAKDYLEKNTEDTHTQLRAGNSKITCFTVAERRFRSPENGDYDKVIFTDATHSKTQYIIDYVFRNFEKFNDKDVYICADPGDNLKNAYKRHKKDSSLSDMRAEMDKWLKDNIKQIDEKNIGMILGGTGDYKNFDYKKISSDGRRELFYGYLMQKAGLEVAKRVLAFLVISGYMSMLKRLKAKGFIHEGLKGRKVKDFKNESWDDESIEKKLSKRIAEFTL